VHTDRYADVLLLLFLASAFEIPDRTYHDDRALFIQLDVRISDEPKADLASKLFTS